MRPDPSQPVFDLKWLGLSPFAFDLVSFMARFSGGRSKSRLQSELPSRPVEGGFTYIDVQTVRDFKCRCLESNP